MELYIQQLQIYSKMIQKIGMLFPPDLFFNQNILTRNCHMICFVFFKPVKNLWFKKGCVNCIIYMFRDYSQHNLSKSLSQQPQHRHKDKWQTTKQIEIFMGNIKLKSFWTKFKFRFILSVHVCLVSVTIVWSVHMGDSQ